MEIKYVTDTHLTPLAVRMIKTVHHHVNTQQDVKALLHFFICSDQLLEDFLHCAHTVGAEVGFDAVYLSL